MLAIAWRWDDAGTRAEKLAARLGSSLCSGIGGAAAAVEHSGVHFAYRPLQQGHRSPTGWRPAILADGRISAFHGYFDNAETIAKELGTDPRDLAGLYGLAVERWGDDADRRIVGEYCAVIVDPQRTHLRLSRSPIKAPPLYYFHDEALGATASVPRALFAAGIKQRLNERRLVDAAMRNLTDDEGSFFDGIAQVPTGCIVELARGGPRVLRRWYNLLDLPFHGVSNDAEAIERAEQLLDEGVRACLRGFGRPGSTLSGGLDSPQVAVRALRALPAAQTLPTFTFHPEADFDGRTPRGMMGNERPLVEALAAMHPRMERHFTSNAGYEHDFRWNELFHLMGAPSGLNTMYVFHGLMSEAAKAGCDVLLLAEWGDWTFSDRGDCAYVEYLLKGHWRQWWLALARPPIHDGSMFRRFVARSLSAFLPYFVWRPLRQLFRSKKTSLMDLAQPLSAEFRKNSGGERRLANSGIQADRYQPWSRRHSRKLLFENGGDMAEVYQGFEQLYGVALRDPTAYRPFVEFCLGLPTRMFMRDGEFRWLAKQMAKGIMPEEQRNNPRFGWWDADWHLRIGRRRQDLLAELDRLESDERFARMFDIPRLRASLEDWPEQTETDPEKAFTPQLAVPAALLTARFVQYVEGRNAP